MQSISNNGRHFYAFNGDADGLCALQQLRLAGGPPGPLVTGVKRDIALLERVAAVPGDHCTVLDVSLDVNRAGLLSLLAGGVSVRYFDHHFTGEVPRHPALETHLDLSPQVCTSLLVDRFLDGQPYMCRMLDISRTGIRLAPILEPDPARAPRTMGLQFQLPDRDDVLTASGEAIRRGGKTVGVRFTNLPPDSAWAIESFLSFV